MESGKIVKEPYFVNILNLVGYTLNSVWDRIAHEVLKVFSRNKAAEKSKAENSIKDNCSESNKADDVDSSRFSIENGRNRALETIAI
jgi:hypothetical protein